MQLGVVLHALSLPMRQSAGDRRDAREGKGMNDSLYCGGRYTPRANMVTPCAHLRGAAAIKRIPFAMRCFNKRHAI